MAEDGAVKLPALRLAEEQQSLRRSLGQGCRVLLANRVVVVIVVVVVVMALAK